MKCANPECRHAESRHNSLGYCRSRTTPDRSGECMCEFYEHPTPPENVLTNDLAHEALSKLRRPLSKLRRPESPG